jgi:hypothetical protein
VEISGYVDADNNPFADAGGGIRAGEKIPCLAYLIKGSFVFTFSALDIFEVEVGDEVDGKVGLTFRGESNGVFTYPGNIVA